MTNKYLTASRGGIAGLVGVVLIALGLAEGGFVDNKDDPGGATNYGITEQVARANGYTGPMKDLPKQTADAIYVTTYMDKPGFTPILELQPALGHKVIDAGVNVGTYRASCWFQHGLNALNRNGKDYPDITVDCKVGPATLNAYKGLERVRGKVRACTLMLKLMDVQQGAHYMSLTNLETFTPGWVDHRIGNVPTSDCLQ